jgi:hypothetical protein
MLKEDARRERKAGQYELAARTRDAANQQRQQNTGSGTFDERLKYYQNLLRGGIGRQSNGFSPVG